MHFLGVFPAANPCSIAYIHSTSLHTFFFSQWKKHKDGHCPRQVACTAIKLRPQQPALSSASRRYIIELRPQTVQQLHIACAAQWKSARAAWQQNIKQNISPLEKSDFWERRKQNKTFYTHRINNNLDF